MLNENLKMKSEKCRIIIVGTVIARPQADGVGRPYKKAKQ